MVIKHFSHRHPLSPYDVEEDQDIICCVCEEEILPTSPAYKCNNKNNSISCEYFRLHKHCFELPREIQHSSHPQHSLTLLPKPPSYLFNCAACAGYNSSFVYNCAACEFALHVRCSGLEELVRREDHQHPLQLVFSLRPERKEEEEEEEEEEKEYWCDICGCCVKEGRWAYLCKECDYVTHLECVSAEAEVFEKEEEEALDYSAKEEEEEEEEEEEDEEEEEEEEEKDEDEDKDDDDLDVIVKNQKKIFVQQMVLNNQINMRRMRTQQKIMMDNTRRLFQFRL